MYLKCQDFLKFLTTCRKLGFICIYIFHLAYSAKGNREMITCQTDIFVLCNMGENSPVVHRILKHNSVRTDNGRHIPGNSLWLSRLYSNLINQNSKEHLMIDNRDCLKSGPARFRSKINSSVKQLCFYPMTEKTIGIWCLRRIGIIK